MKWPLLVAAGFLGLHAYLWHKRRTIVLRERAASPWITS